MMPKNVERLNEKLKKEYGEMFLGCSIQKGGVMYHHPPDSLLCRFDVDLPTDRLEPFFTELPIALDDIENELGHKLAVVVLRT